MGRNDCCCFHSVHLMCIFDSYLYFHSSTPMEVPWRRCHSMNTQAMHSIPRHVGHQTHLQPLTLDDSARSIVPAKLHEVVGLRSIYNSEA